MKSNEVQGFTLGLALADAIPVVLFALILSCIMTRFHNNVFLSGGILTIVGGTCKVLWKILLACRKKDYHFLNRPLFIVLMPSGFLLMLLALAIACLEGEANLLGVLRACLGFPSVLFFIPGILGLVAMTIYVKCHDKSDAKNNWIEQLTNSFAQLMFLLGILVM